MRNQFLLVVATSEALWYFNGQVIERLNLTFHLGLSAMASPLDSTMGIRLVSLFLAAMWV
jgi:hypothetical protein